MNIKLKVGKLIEILSKGLYERNDIVAKTLLALLAGESVFLFGPPGTAKSLIARRVAQAFQGGEGGISYFEYLMNRFSTPDEVFGPVSIKELKNDRYVRQTAGYLPEAHIAFLDEIWKASPAILNTLLTLVNERKFKNGGEVKDAPLKGLVAASNEVPEPGQGLEALYDRFIMRLKVLPMAERENFERYLQSGGVSDRIKRKKIEEFQISEALWTELNGSAAKKKISSDVLEIIHSLRVKMEKLEKPIYVSDRRWKKAVKVLQMSAAINERTEVEPIDAMLLPSVLWSKPEEADKISELLQEALNCGFAYEVKDTCDGIKEKLDAGKKRWKEASTYIDDEYESDEYDYVTVDHCINTDQSYYSSFSYKLPFYFLLKNKGEITVEASGFLKPYCYDNRPKKVVLKIEKDGYDLIATWKDRYNDACSKTTLEPKHKKGEEKQIVLKYLEAFRDEAKGIEMRIAEAEQRLAMYEEKTVFDSLFASSKETECLKKAINERKSLISDLRIGCEKLQHEIEYHAHEESPYQFSWCEKLQHEIEHHVVD